MTEQEMKLLHERVKKEDPRLLVLMEKCFDAGVMSGKEQAQRPWVGLTNEEIQTIWRSSEHMNEVEVCRAIEAKLKAKNSL